MKTTFRNSFAKDLRSVKNSDVRHHIAQLIEQIEQASDLTTIPNLKRLRAKGAFYRVRLGDYRIGLTVRGGVVTFVRCLDRKEIYRYFP